MLAVQITRLGIIGWQRIPIATIGFIKLLGAVGRNGNHLGKCGLRSLCRNGSYSGRFYSHVERECIASSQLSVVSSSCMSSRDMVVSWCFHRARLGRGALVWEDSGFSC